MRVDVVVHRAASARTRVRPVTAPGDSLAKRVLDVVILIPLALVALPLVVACAICVMAVSPGNPFYYQHREGRNGTRIRVWKLRTMYRDAEALLERHLAEYPEARSEWLRTYKLRHDPRILPLIGTLLRRSSLDETPQLWNVTCGEMSFIGPRPLPDHHLAAFGDDFLALRRSVRPGITGLWQVGGRSDGGVDRLKELDRRYISGWSVWMDLRILWATPWAVLTGKGAY
jgi:lipopolysaccharide/colanic/teichoic acid biosynthesis glycosyltransferase